MEIALTVQRRSHGVPTLKEVLDVLGKEWPSLNEGFNEKGLWISNLDLDFSTERKS